MNKNDFPNENEWKKIVEDAFSSDEEHIFSEHYKLNKQQMLRRVTMTKKTFNKKRGLAVIAAAVVITAAIPLSVFAYEKLTAKIEKTANYENTISIQTPVADTENTEAPKYMFYEFGWVPEGYVPSTEKGGFTLDSDEIKGGISPLFYKLPDDMTLELSLPFSAECETYEAEGKTALINYREPHVFFDEIPYTREVFVSFEGTSYVLDISITKDISHEDLLKIIDNITLYPTEEKLHGDYIPWLDESNYQSDSYSPQKFYAYEENVRTIGDTVSNPYTGNGIDGYDVTLNSFELTDSFDGITTDSGGDETDFSHLMDENGNIIENIRTTIKLGDGVNTIDEIISEEVVPMHILKMNVTITNTADIENDICICPTMFIIEDGEPIVNWEVQDEYSCYDSILGLERQSMWFSLAMDSDQKGGKNHLILAPNESADVQIAFFVDDNVKDKVYVSFEVSGNNFGEYFDVNG